MDIGIVVLFGLVVVCFFSLVGFIMYLKHKEYMNHPKTRRNDGHMQDGYFYSKTTKKTNKETI